MANEEEKQDIKQEKPVQEKTKAAEPGKLEGKPLAETVEALMDYGGFDLIKDTVEGAGSMDPEAKARKNLDQFKRGHREHDRIAQLRISGQ